MQNKNHVKIDENSMMRVQRNALKFIAIVVRFLPPSWHSTSGCFSRWFLASENSTIFESSDLKYRLYLQIVGWVEGDEIYLIGL